MYVYMYVYIYIYIYIYVYKSWNRSSEHWAFLKLCASLR